ncbi:MULTISPECIES: hypothetical protein [unclassified Streptomyces]|uniref:hypothetical protein n=1 Tax=unclassified Streptomyces TaxID=2593676 RepID=UPI002E15231E|nr:hypothetical protein OG457_49495 [Streptomyces sp. NBC_01207]
MTITLNRKALAIGAAVLATVALVLFLALRQTPAEAGAEFGKELAEVGTGSTRSPLGGLSPRQLGTCTGEASNRYKDDKDKDEFQDACVDAARIHSY